MEIYSIRNQVVTLGGRYIQIHIKGFLFRALGGPPILTGGDARRTSWELKSWVLLPLRVFNSKYLHLHITRYLLGLLRSFEWHFI